MNLITVKAALEYLVDQSVPFQLTGDGHGSFSLDLHSKIHAKVLWEELRSDGKQLDLLERPYFYRLH